MATFDFRDFLSGLKEALVEAAKEGKEGQTSSISAISAAKIEPYGGTPNENLSRWLFQITDMFEIKKTSLETRFKLLSGYLKGNALQWYITVRKQGRLEDIEYWDDFIILIRKAFERADEPLFLRRQLKQLRQERSLQDYIGTFRNISGQLDDASEMELISYFTEGLKEVTRAEVLGKCPETLNEAITIAVGFDSARFEKPNTSRHNSKHEQRRDKYWRGDRPRNYGNAFNQDRRKYGENHTGEQPMEIGNTGNKKFGGNSERKCHNCGRYGHIAKFCRNRQANAVDMKIEKGGKTQVTDGKEDDDAQTAGENHRLLVLDGIVEGREVKVLVDSGASYNFLSSHFISNCPQLKSKMKEKNSSVYAVDGGEVDLKGSVTVDISLGEATERVLTHIIPIARYELILGKPWLFDRNPYINWRDGTIKFEIGNQVVELRNSNSNNKHVWTKPLIPSGDVSKDDELFIMQVTLTEDKKDVSHPPVVKDLAIKYPNAFSDQLEFPVERKWDHHIDVQGSEPIAQKNYKMSPLELDYLKKELDKLLALNFIRPSNSPWSSPVLFVKKKDGTLRLCVDYRALNKVSKSDKYPIPRIDELLERLSTAKIFSRMDLASGYHQIRMKPESIDKTAFKTRYGHFEYLVMPFGLKNAPGTFQRIMNDLFFDFLDKFVLVYLDDILVYSENEQQHMEHLHLVLDRLEKNYFKLKLEKCSFFEKELEFLGFIVNESGIAPDPKKIRAIQELQQPNDLTSLRSFLGLCGFYRKFVQNYSEIVAPLTHLLKKQVIFHWKENQQQAFEYLKTAISSAPILKLPDFSKPYILTCDASGVAVGGVLAQVHNGFEFPIAFESRMLTTAEKNYPTHEQELLAIVHCCKVFRCYIEGRDVTIRTDHASLKFLPTQKHLSRRLCRWLEFLETLNLNYEYKPGKLNVVADALSRPQVNLIEESDWPSLYVRYKEEKDLIAKEEGDQVVELLEKNKENFIVENDLVLKLKTDGSRVAFIPFISRADIVEKVHAGYGHLGGDATYNLLKTRAWWSGMQNDIRKWVSNCLICQKHRVDKAEHEKLHPLPPVAPFKRWGLDFIGILPETDKGNRWLITGIDYGTRWPIARAIPAATSFETAKFLYEEIMCRFGCPAEIVTDRGSAFMSDVLEEYLRLQRTKHLRTTAFHPRTNGMVEKLNGSIGDMITKKVEDHTTLWDRFVDEILFNLRVRTHTTTGVSPFYMVYGVNATIPGDLTHPSLLGPKAVDLEELNRWRELQMEKVRAERQAIMARNEEAQRKTKEWFDSRVEEEALDLNDLIYLKKPQVRKFETPYAGPYRIASKYNNGTFKLKTLENVELPDFYHRQRLKKIKSGMVNPIAQVAEEETVPKKRVSFQCGGM